MKKVSLTKPLIVKVYLTEDKEEFDTGEKYYTYGICESMTEQRLNLSQGLFIKQHLEVCPIDYEPDRIDYYRSMTQVDLLGDFKVYKFENED